MIEDLIRKLEARDTLSEREKELLRSAMTEVKTYEPREDMVVEGQSPSASTLLVEGFAVRYKTLVDGGRQITEIHVPGDFVDLHSFLMKPMDHSVAALSGCQVVELAHKDIARITETEPHLARMLWLSTLIDGSVHREWLVAMGRRTALGQAAHLLCELYVRLRVVGRVDGGEFSVPVTQADLGDTLGLSGVHVNRVIQELRARELIAWKGRIIQILDWDGLAEIAEFDDRYLHLVKRPR